MNEKAATQSQTTDSKPSKDPIIRVLHVDDDDDFLVISERLLGRQKSFQVECVSSVKEALEKLEQKPYDAIISDFQLFGRNGLEFLKELRDRDNNILFFILSGELRDKIIDDAFNLGVDGCFCKTVQVESVFMKLASAIKEALNL